MEGYTVKERKKSSEEVKRELRKPKYGRRKTLIKKKLQKRAR